MCNIWRAYTAGQVMYWMRSFVIDIFLLHRHCLNLLISLSSPLGSGQLLTSQKKTPKNQPKKQQRKPVQRVGLELKGCHSADSCQSFETISQGCKVAKASGCWHARLQICLRQKCWKNCQEHRYQRQRPKSWNGVSWEASHLHVLGVKNRNAHMVTKPKSKCY